MIVKMEHEEKKETPEMEAKHHKTSFLKKAEKMSKEHKIKAEKKSPRKKG